MFDKKKIEQAITLLLEGIGEDVTREGLVDTPNRVARMYEELLSGMNQDPGEHLARTFSCDNSDVVIEKDGMLYPDSMFGTDSHLMPFYGKAHIAYIPNGKVVGISKLARTVEVYARRLQIQEQMTNQIADALMEYLDAKGVLVLVEAEHMCMSARGIKKPGSKTITIASRGEFNADKELKREIMGVLQCK